MSLRSVLVNAKPGWAYFTIDSDPTQYQTLAKISLSVGKHTIHFTQGEVRKSVAIDVPNNDDLRIIADFEGSVAPNERSSAE